VPAAVETSRLHKRYGSVEALRGVDLLVETGSVFGLLGPNGAGKTTAVRILTTLLKPDEGSARVVGYDVVREAASVRREIGLAGQYAAVDENLTGFENLDMVGRLYGKRRAEARRRADELLDRFSLSEAGGRIAKTYSGGMRRRLDLAAALVADPPVLFLDEPTTGLDPRSRLELWETIEALVAEGTTVLLTTQYLDEADQLADRIAVIDHGRVIAEGTPSQLKAEVGSGALHVRLHDPAQRQAAADLLSLRLGDEIHLEPDPAAISSRVAVPERVAPALAELGDAGIAVSEYALGQPSLDEVFLALTDHPAEEETEEPTEPHDAEEATR